MNKPLLSIAVPTWNRANILSLALMKLLPQVNKYNNLIEMIISDNNSDDNTKEIINRYVRKYPNIRFNLYFQEKNTGYFGNFKKCREISSGKFLWLLSDNEHISENTISNILDILKCEEEIGIIFLHLSSINNTEYLSFEKLVFKYNYKLTLLSSCIMANIKDNDNDLFNNYSSNLFLSFLFVLNTRIYRKKAAVIKGNLYRSVPASVSFNIFNSWTKDIFECFDFAKSNNLLNDNLIYTMKESIIKNVLNQHLINYKIYKKLVGKKYGTFEEVYNKLKKYYGDLECFHEVTEYICKKSRLNLLIQLYIRDMLRKIKKLIVLFKN